MSPRHKTSILQSLSRARKQTTDIDAIQSIETEIAYVTRIKVKKARHTKEKLGRITVDDYERIHNLLIKFGLPGLPQLVTHSGGRYEYKFRSITEEIYPTESEVKSSHSSIHYLYQQKRLLDRDGPNCAYCHNPLNTHNVTQDHVHPLSRGGSNHINNKVLSCRSCNKRKGNLFLLEFFMGLIDDIERYKRRANGY